MLCLVVDDDADTRQYLAALLSSLGHTVDDAETGEQALSWLAAGNVAAVILLDLVLPGMNGLQLLDQTRRSHPEIPVIVLSGESETKTVVDAVRRGASDYLTKPFERQELERALQHVLGKREAREEVRSTRLLTGGDTELVSSNAQMVRIREIARQVADTDAPIVMSGESGVGKEVLARYVHGRSQRAGQPFIKVNCAALPRDLLESELFGYEKGAFSGAFREKPGMFELAGQGSILLDEIGEMAPNLQAKLLHVLQDGGYTRLGGRHLHRVDARVLASTNIHLDEAVRAGHFRADLYFRLNVIRIEIPPLRNRRDDIPMLCAHFLRIYAARYRSRVRELPRELRDAFQRYDWPGNVRELENAVRRYVILPDMENALSYPATSGGTAEPPSLAGPRKAESSDAGFAKDVSLRKVGAQAAEDAERVLLRRTLADTHWNRKQAASVLQISYKALLNKLKKWEVEEPA